MSDEYDPVGNLRLALDLHEAGVELMRQNCRRAHPRETAEEIEARIRTWLASPDIDASTGCFRPGSLRSAP